MRILVIAAIALIMGCKEKDKVAEAQAAVPPVIETEVQPASDAIPEPVKPADPTVEEKLKEVEAKAKECDCKCPSPKSKKSKHK